MAVNPTALDSTVEQHLYTSYLDYFAGIRGGAVTLPLQHRGRLSTHVGVRFMNYGRFDETTASGDIVGRFSGGDYAVQGGATWALDSLLTFGVTGFTGLRNLEKFNAGVLGMDVGVVRRSPDGLRALGLLVSNLGFQTDFSGIMPDGRLPHNVQIGWTQGFPDAPFTFHLRFQRLETWDLAPEGTYDDALDPLTGELIPNGTWVWGDQFFHTCVPASPSTSGHSFVAMWDTTTSVENDGRCRKNRFERHESGHPGHLQVDAFQVGAERLPSGGRIDPFGLGFATAKISHKTRARRPLMFKLSNLSSTHGQKSHQHRH